MAKDRRPYFVVSNELFRHPKFLRLSDKARLYLLELWGYCNQYMTDGLIEDFILKEKGASIAKELIRAGWVDETKDAEIFMMHDYLLHQKSRAEIESLIDLKKDQGSRGGIKSAHVRHHVNKGVFSENCELCVTAIPPKNG